MNPFFFGPSDRPLFGLFTRGRGGPTGAALLCYPVGVEYMRAHRAFRQLNVLLNRAGMDVLRFDYSCTGDSAGRGADADFQLWIDDTVTAAEELRENSGLETFSVVGLRWGATIAASAATRMEGIDQLVLWDPIVSGASYFDERIGKERPSHVVGIDGFPFSPDLVRQMDAVDLSTIVPALRGIRTTILAAEQEATIRDLAERLRAVGAETSYRMVESPGDWSVAEQFGDALIPHAIIAEAVNQLKSAAR